MKLTKLTAALILSQAVSTSAFAVTSPVYGWYVGLGGGVSYTPNITINHVTLSCTSADPACLALQNNKVKLDYKLLGNVFGSIGYKQEKYRVEAEIFGTGNKLKNIFIRDPSGNYLKLNNSSASGDPITFKGQTTLIGVLANGYYDFYKPGQESNWVPYVGLGIGFGSANTSVNLNCNPTNWTNPPANCNGEIPGAKISSTESTVVGQVAAGASYYMDSYSTIFLDYRFITTGSLRALDTRYQVQTINFGFNFALDNFFDNT